MSFLVDAPLLNGGDLDEGECTLASLLEPREEVPAHVQGVTLARMSRGIDCKPRSGDAIGKYEHLGGLLVLCRQAPDCNPNGVKFCIWCSNHA